MRKTILLTCAALVVSLLAWPAIGEELAKRKPRESPANGNRDVLTLTNGAEFKGVILAEEDESIRFLVVTSPDKTHKADVPLDRVRKISRLKPQARKAVREKLEADQRKAEEDRLVKAMAAATPYKVIYFWRAPGYERGIFSGASGAACASQNHVTCGPHGRFGYVHYLTPSGIDLAQRNMTDTKSPVYGYGLVELYRGTFIPVFGQPNGQ